MIFSAARRAGLAMFCLCALQAGAGAQETSQDVWSPGRIIGDISESTGIHVKAPPAPTFVTKTRPPEWELDYRPLEATTAEPPPDAGSAARAAGQELDAARAENRRLATGVPAPVAKNPAGRPKKGMDPFDSNDDATTN